MIDGAQATPESSEADQHRRRPAHQLVEERRPPIYQDLAIAYIPCYYAIMIRSFKSRGTEDIFNGSNTRVARQVCPQALWRIAARKLDQLDSVVMLEELRIPPGNRLEALSGTQQGQYSIRINDQYRIYFVWNENEPDEVEIVDYH